jgi:hypothetical protein
MNVGPSGKKCGVCCIPTGTSAGGVVQHEERMLTKVPKCCVAAVLQARTAADTLAPVLSRTRTLPN